MIRWLKRTLLVLVGASVVGGGALWILLPRLPGLIEQHAISAAAEAGIVGLELRVERLGWRQAVVTGVRLGSEGPSVDRIAAVYHPWDLVTHRHIEWVEVSTIWLAASLEGGVMSLPGLDPVLADTGADRENGDAVALPISIGTLLIEDVTLAVSSDQGLARMSIGGTVRHIEDQNYAGAFRLEAQVAPKDQGSLTITGTTTFEGGPDALHMASAKLKTNLPSLPHLDNPEARLHVLARDGQIVADLTLRADQGTVLTGAILPLSSLSGQGGLAGKADVSVALEGIGPGIALSGSADLALKDGAVHVTPTSRLTVTQGDTSLTVPSSDRPVAHLPLDGSAVRLDLPEGRLTVAGEEILLGGFRAQVEPAISAVTLNGVDLYHLGTPAYVGPLRLSGTARQKREGALVFTTRLADPLGRLVIETQGQHDPRLDQGAAKVTLHPLRFQPGVLQPEDLFPSASGFAKDISGTIKATGPISWSGGKPTSDLKITLADIKARIGDMVLEGLSGRITLDNPWPPSTPPEQRLTARSIRGNAVLEDLDLTFQVAGAEHILLDQLWARIADGVVSIGSLELPLTESPQDLLVVINGVGVQELLSMFEIPDTEATGRLVGSIPLTVSGTEFKVENALLETEGAGRLHYRPDAPPVALQAGGEAATLMMKALENFHYEALSLAAARETTGEWDATLHMTGANPDLMEGYPFEFNINLSGKIDEILRRGLASYRLPETLGTALSGFGTKRP